ncbi:hypothetical protein DLH72_00620 [Candidatus Gracilibacteria bacterium]|nr:MAG: hypothetical protein DLH72_00620 [Candidatus Gracilibacteria bacterium]
MFGFYYEYNKSSDILKNMTKIKDYSLTEILVLVLGLFIILLMVFLIVPSIKKYIIKKKNENEKNLRKRMIDKIVLQKNLEDLVMREVNEKNLKK